MKYLNDRFAPAWKTIEFIPFGAVLHIYRNLIDEHLRKVIAGSYSIKTPGMLENYLGAIVYVRNMCSHSGVIFDLQQPKSLMKIPGCKAENLHSLWASILALKFILKSISLNRLGDLQEELKALFNKFQNDDIVRKVIETKIGYSYPV